jgi:tetratricopeptide (TPR) repeat protein
MRVRQRGVDIRPEAARQARLEAGLSLAQLADGEVTRAAIHLVETGKMRPSRRTLELIARKTHRPISYFLPGRGSTDSERSARDQLERLVQTEEFAAAIELANRLLDQHLPTGFEADVHLLLGRALVRLHNGEDALDHLRLARAVFDELGDAVMGVEALDQEATALFLLDDPNALAMSVEALRRCQRLTPPSPALEVLIRLHLASIQFRRGDAQSMVALLEKALQLSTIEPNVRHIAGIHDSLSLAYQQLGQFSLAVNHAQRAFALYSMDRDVRSLVRIENNLGYILLQQGELDAARSHLTRALHLCDERGLDRWARAPILCDLAELHLATEELEQSDRLLRDAIEVARTQNERPTLAAALCLLGRLRLKQDDERSADLAFAEAIAIFEHLNMPERVRDCHIEYAEALQARGQLEQSIVHWRAAAEAGRQSAVSSSVSVSILEEAGA